MWLQLPFNAALPKLGADLEEPLASACTSSYQARLREFLALSSASTRFTPREHMPEWYWEKAVDVRNRHLQAGRAAFTPEAVGHRDRWLEHSFGVARTELLGCWVAGGRYWEAQLRLRDYASALPANASAVLPALLAQLEARLGIVGLPRVLRSGMCAPAGCGGPELRAALLPRFLGLLLGLPSALPALRPEHAEALELADWSELSLDFVIAGVDGCGSTSLHRNLARHPEIGFTGDDEDGFFGQVIQHRLLPLRSQVDAFNGRWSGARRRPRILGLCNPTVFSNALARQALALISGVRLVIVLCDPLGRNEKHFMEHHFCREDGATAAVGAVPPARLHRGNCDLSIAAFLDRPEMLFQRTLGPHLAEVTDIFGTHLMLLHQESLQEMPHATYSAIAAFVGASTPFAEEAAFHRYNSQRGHRTDLCRNASLVSALQRQLEADYRLLERLLGDAAPESLRGRQTRCDRPEELSEDAPRCGNRSARCTY